jgi:ribosomal protein S6--L-glutamate ligase
MSGSFSSTPIADRPRVPFCASGSKPAQASAEEDAQHVSLVVLTAHPHLNTPRRLLEAGERAGIAVALRRPGDRDAPERGARILLARLGTFSLVAVLREHRRLVARGAEPLQSRRALLDACDQWRTLRRAAAADLPIPATALVRRPAELRAALARIGGPPWFVKGRRGSQGTHVLLAATLDEAIRAAHLFWGTGGSCLIQEDLRARGPIERHLVAGRRVLASAIARPAPGEFRSNAHRGGRFQELPSRGAAAVGLALAAVAALGLPCAAVDAIGGESPALLEVNASPGIEALERATGRDLAAELLLELVPTRACRASRA